MTIGALIAEACRELGMRQRVYGRAVSEGRMHPAAARNQLLAQEEIITALEYVQSLEPEYDGSKERGLPSI